MIAALAALAGPELATFLEHRAGSMMVDVLAYRLVSTDARSLRVPVLGLQVLLQLLVNHIIAWYENSQKSDSQVGVGIAVLPESCLGALTGAMSEPPLGIALVVDSKPKTSVAAHAKTPSPQRILHLQISGTARSQTMARRRRARHSHILMMAWRLRPQRSQGSHTHI